MSDQKEYILCAAIHYDDGKKYVHQAKNIESGFVVAGRRHHNCITTISILTKDYDKSLLSGEAQGFITSLDRFVGRKEAWIIAKEAGQIQFGLKASDNGSDSRLVSENLYSEDLF